MANGWFDFVNGQTLPASRVQDYLMNQSVMVFIDDLDRSSGIPTPTAGMVTFLTDSGDLWFYTGSAWSLVSPPVVIPETLSPILLIGA